MEIKGARALLTGATGGIGSALAGSLAERGAHLLLVGRDRGRLEALERHLGAEQGGRVAFVAASLTEAAGRARVLQAAEEFRINLVINNAGVSRFALLEQQDEADLEAQLGTNLMAPMFLVARLLPLLRRQSEAQILNIGSTFGSLGFAGFAPYCATKFGLRGFSEALRRELAGTKITVSYLAPRGARTAMNPSAVVAMNAELGSAMDEPARVAEAALRMIVRGERERFIGQPEGVFALLNSLWPGVVDGILQGKLPIIRRYADNPIGNL